MLNKECSAPSGVCLNDFTIFNFVSTSCNHFFCKNCCGKIVSQNQSLCPMCRRKFDYLFNNSLYYQYVKSFK